MTDQELNEAVAVKLGFVPNNGQLIWENAAHVTFLDCEMPDYCHSIEAAWELTSAFRGELMLVQYKNEWVAKWGIWKTARAATAPMAICLAFLKLNA